MSSDLVTVEPGQIAQIKLRIKNIGEQVARFTLSPVEDCGPAPWTEIVPPEVRLLKGETADATILFKPPRSSRIGAGVMPYAIRVVPGPNDAQLPRVVEGDLAVGAIHALDVRLEPLRPRGRFKSQFRVLVENRGTERLRVELEPTDGEQQRRLQFSLARPTVILAPGGQEEAFLQVRPDRVLPFGQATGQSFELQYRRRSDRPTSLANTGELAEDIVASVQGTYVQKPMISRWMIMAVLLLALVVAAVVLWRRANPPAVLVPPPDPPIDIEFTAQEGEPARFSVTATETATDVEASLFACELVDTPLRQALPGASANEPLAAGAGGGELAHEAVNGQQLCAQFRVIENGVRSRWIDRSTTVGAEIQFDQVKPMVKNIGPRLIRVSWEAPTTIGLDPQALTYEIMVDGTPVDTVTGRLEWTSLTRLPGDELEVAIWVQVISPSGGQAVPSQSESHSLLGDTGIYKIKRWWIYFDGRRLDEGQETPFEWTNIEVILGLLNYTTLPDRRVLGAEVVFDAPVTIPPRDGDTILYLDDFASKTEADTVCDAFNGRLREMIAAGSLVGAPPRACEVRMEPVGG